jgi:hypothetical protein
VSSTFQQQSTKENGLKKTFSILSIMVAVVTYGYLIVVTARGNGEGLSLVTFLLWSIIALISAFSMVAQKADATVPFIWGVGGMTVAVILGVKGRFGWMAVDTVVTILVTICIVLWLISGPRWALIFSIVASWVATYPFVIMTWKAPEQSPVVANIGFFIANLFMLVSAKAWTIEDRLFPLASSVLCLILILPWLLNPFALTLF